MLYQLGQGVNPDPTLEYTWLSKAADQGHSEAQYELAFFYLIGSEEVGIDKDVQAHTTRDCRF
jgi:TPR repeat protein